jgi:hypothetical protein
MSDRLRWTGSGWDDDGWGGGGCAPCPPAPCPPQACTAQPCPPVACPPCPPPWFGPPRPPWYPGASGGVSFGTTPPQFPIRGHFWWDGATLHMWDGVEWETIGPASGADAPVDGKVYGRQNAAWVQVPTSTMVFAITQPATINIGVNIWAIVPNSATPQFDTQSGWNSSTHQFTAKVPGLYLFNIREYSLVGTGGTVAIELYKNDAGTFGTGMLVAVQSISAAAGSASYMSATGLVQMNGTTDFVRLWGYTSSGNLNGAGGSPVMSATLLA